MAVATAIIEDVEVTTTEEQTTGVELELTLAEAKALRTLLYRGVAGYPNGTRGQLDAINDALRDADIEADEDVKIDGVAKFQDGSYQLDGDLAKVWQQALRPYSYSYPQPSWAYGSRLGL